MIGLTGAKEMEAEKNPHPLAGMHRRAMNYARLVRHLGPAVLADRLYSYNTVPADRAWHERCDGPDRGMQWLGRPSTRLSRKYRISSDAHWRQWNRIASLRAPLLHKLYISPMPAALPEVFSIVTQTCAAAEIAAFKIGLGSIGLFRPDKLVLYFAAESDRSEIGSLLGRSLRGAPVQGVPFAPAVDVSAIISWGIDSVPVGGSWRRYVTLKLADATNAGCSGDLLNEALKEAGVDPVTWVPLAWREP